MQTAFKIIVISFFIALVSAGVGFLLKGGGGTTSGPSGPSAPVSGSGILYSEDFGETWVQRSEVAAGQNLSRYNILEIVIHPKNTSVVYAGTEGGGLYRSLDAGVKWEPVDDENDILSNRATIRSIAVDPDDPQKIFVAIFQGARGSILRSDDGAKSFAEVYFTTRDKIGVNSVVITPANHDQIFVGTDDGLVLQSANRGESWKRVSEFTTPVKKLYQLPSGALLAVVNTKGLVRSEDGGITWAESKDTEYGKRLNSFMNGTNIEYLAADRQNPNTIYLGTGYGILRSRDGGVSFEALPIVIPPKSLPVVAVGVDPTNSQNILVAVGNAIYRSVDGGEHWSPHMAPTDKRIRILTMFPDNGHKILAGISK